MQRKVLYIYYKPNKKEYVFHGLTFKEFLLCHGDSLNILLLDNKYLIGDYHDETGFEYVLSNQINSIIDEDLYSHGDFCWVDFERFSSLKKIKSINIAELLYLKHKFKPLKSTLIDILKNKYIYLSHDDGWYTKIYCNNKNEFNKILLKIIKTKIQQINKSDFDFDDKVEVKIKTLIKEGLLIDFKKLNRSKKRFVLPAFTIGQICDMDNLINSLEQYKKNGTKHMFELYMNSEK